MTDGNKQAKFQEKAQADRKKKAWLRLNTMFLW